MINKITEETDRLSNLIISMLSKNATDDEVKRVIRHSVFVLDAARSYENNGIAEIEAKYQNS